MYSYHGDLSALVSDLRRKDMLRVASEYSDTLEFPRRLRELPARELREVCLAVFEGRYMAPRGLDRVSAADEEILISRFLLQDAVEYVGCRAWTRKHSQKWQRPRIA